MSSSWTRLIGCAVVMALTPIVAHASAFETRDRSMEFEAGSILPVSGSPILLSPEPAPFSFLPPEFSQTYIRMVGVGRSDNRRCANQLFAAGLLNGYCDRISAAEYNSLTPQQLRDRYDVVLFCSDESQNAPTVVDGSWVNRLLPYLLLGGGVIWENNLDFRKYVPEVNAFPLYRPGGISVINQVPGLTDGVTDNFFNVHHGYARWNPRLKPFLKYKDGSIVGLYGEYPGGGRILFTGTDSDAHAHLLLDGSPLGITVTNQYYLVRNEIIWVFSGRK